MSFLPSVARMLGKGGQKRIKRSVNHPLARFGFSKFKSFVKKTGTEFRLSIDQ